VETCCPLELKETGAITGKKTGDAKLREEVVDDAKRADGLRPLKAFLPYI